MCQPSQTRVSTRGCSSSAALLSTPERACWLLTSLTQPAQKGKIQVNMI